MRARTIARTIIVASGAFVIGCASGPRATSSTPAASGWSTLPGLPDAHGFAGAYAGVSNGALVVAGGANFPGDPPWKGGTKAWYDDAFILPKGASNWIKIEHAMPAPRGYGVSITLPSGIVCIGGADAKQHYADAFTLEWDGKRLVKRALPPLPRPLANVAGAAIGSTIYVVGGIESPAATSASNHVLAIDLSAPNPQWRELEPLPGPGRILPVVGASKDAIYVVSGASLAPDAAGKPSRTYLTDAYRYTNSSGWKQIADVPSATVAAPSPAVPFGTSDLAIFGGDDGANVNFEPKEQHPGFSRDVLGYDAKANTWRVIDHMPLGQVTTTVVPYSGGFVIPSGEIRPAVRTPIVTLAPTSKWEGR